MFAPTLVTLHLVLAMQAAPTFDAARASAPAPAEAVRAEAAPVPLARQGDAALFADLSDEAVLARAIDVIAGIDTLRARFAQTSPTGAVSAGTVSMDRPGRLRFQYDAPSTQDIVATGGLVYVHDTDLETTDSYPVGQTPLRFLLSEDVRADDVVLTGVTRMPGEVAVALQATDDELAGEVALVFAGTADDLTLDRWAVVDPQGGVTVVQLMEVETGVKLSRRLFRIPETERRFGNDRR